MTLGTESEQTMTSPTNQKDTPDLNRKDKSVYRNWTKAIIRYSDLDPNAHVNNGAINAYFEAGRVHFRDANLVTVADDLLTGFVLANFSVTYHAPLFYPGTVDIGTSVLRVGRSSYVLGQAVFSGDVCAATADTVTVRTNEKGSVPLEDNLRAILHSQMPE